MTAWPGTLPQRLSARDYKFSLPDNTIRTQMDAGPPKVRRRTTANVGHISGSMVMSTSQWSTLLTFFQSTVQETMQFTFPNPDDDGSTSITVRFKSPPDKSFFAPGNWRISLDFEVMP